MPGSREHLGNQPELGEALIAQHSSAGTPCSKSKRRFWFRRRKTDHMENACLRPAAQAPPAGASLTPRMAWTPAARAPLARVHGVTEAPTPTISQSSHDPFKHLKVLFSGAMSAVVSRTCVAPLERVKMELVLKQTNGNAITTAADVLRTEGLGGFWKGNIINVLRTAPFKALNFFSFDIYHKALVQMVAEDGNFARFAAGACAGITATTVCFPLDVVRTRLMAKGTGPRYGGPWGTITGIVKHEGVRGLYTGCLPALVGMAPAGAIFYGVFDLLKHNHLERMAAQRGKQDDGKPLHLPPLQTLLFGAVAGISSEVVVYPLEVVRRRMQLQGMAMAATRAGVLRGPTAIAAAAGAVPAAQGFQRVLATCNEVIKADGFAGFYSGMAPSLLQVLPSSALSYYTYDTLKRVLKADL